MRRAQCLIAVTVAAVSLAVTMGCGAAYAIPEIIAHRGASADAPENTVGSAKLAWKQNADAVELDIYLTADHQLAVIHDGNTVRVTGVSMKVSRSEMAELRTLDAGKWKGAKWAGEKIPTLTEILNTVPAGKQLFIEIKCGGEITADLLKALDASGKDPSQTVIISFNADAIRDVKAQRPSLKTYFLCSPNAKNIDDLIRKVRVIKADGIDGCASAGFDAAVIAKMREAKMGVYVWTIDDEKNVKKYAELGVDGITTNKPAVVREMLTGSAK